MDSKGIAWQCNGQQRKGIDKLSVARAMRRMGMKRDAEEKQRHSKDRLGMAKHRSAKASQGIAWQCSARAEL